MFRLRALPLMLLVLAWGAPAPADPRWWWDDAQVSPTSASDLDLDLTPGYPQALWLAWVSPPGMIEGSLLLTVSFDGGCTFCPPARLATVFDANAEVSVAAVDHPGPMDFATYTVQVLHAEGGGLQVHHASVVVFTRFPPAQWCDALADATWTATPLADSGADRPDIAGERSWNLMTPTAHFHAVWRNMAPTDELDVHYARDLAGDGTGWRVVGAISPPAPPAAALDDPHVTADFFTDGADGTSAVNVAWSAEESRILYLRSTNSGDTFSATGDPLPSAPAQVNESMPYPLGPLALDSGTRPGGGAAGPLWHGIFWDQGRQLVDEVRFDAQFQRAPAAPDPAWGSDIVVDGIAVAPDVTFAASVLPGGEPGAPAPLFLFWNPPAPDLLTRAGLLEADAAVPVDLGTFPFAPVRATDPSVSTTAQLTACVFDEATGGCTPARAAGTARKVASDEDGLSGDVFVAWIDDRDRTPSVWFKRTDRSVDAPRPTLETSCPTAGTRRITVSFLQNGSCRTPGWTSAERIRRYSLYYGQSQGGPYPDRVEILDDGSLPDPVTADLDGLAPATTYWVIVVPEDEARNVSPPDFDPLAHRSDAPFNEASITTIADCSPPRCLYRATAPGRVTTGLFVGPPRPASDIAFAAPNDVPYVDCAVSFPPGDPDPEAVLDPGMPELIFYQVDGADVRDLTVTTDRALHSVRISF